MTLSALEIGGKEDFGLAKRLRVTVNALDVGQVGQGFRAWLSGKRYAHSRGSIVGGRFSEPYTFLSCRPRYMPEKTVLNANVNFGTDFYSRKIILAINEKVQCLFDRAI